jgi:hypothetical protein
MGHQLSDRLFQFFLAGGVFGKRLGMKGRQQMFPNLVRLRLHVARVGGDGDDRVLFGHHDAELSGGAVAAAEAIVPAAPELKPNYDLAALRIRR